MLRGAWTVFLAMILPGFASAAGDSLELVSRVHPSQISDTGGVAEPATGPAAFYSESSPSISDDGRYVAFISQSANLVPGQKDVNFTNDVFVRDLFNGTTALVSRSMASPATAGNGSSDDAAISGDGRFIVFASRATDLVPGQASDVHGLDKDLLLHDRLTGTTSLIAASLDRFTAEFRDLALSKDGRYIVFASENSSLVPGDTPSSNDVFLYDRVQKTLRLVRQNSPIQSSGKPVISGDGKFIAFFGSSAVDPSVASAYVYDRTSGALTPIAPARESLAMSADGKYIAAADGGSLVLHNRETGEVTSLANAAGGTESYRKFFSLSADGRFLAFLSPRNLVPGQPPFSSGTQLYLYDRVSRSLTLVSKRQDPFNSVESEDAADPTISANGRFITFTSYAPDLVPGQMDPESSPDVFLFDRVLGTTRLVSGKGGSASTTANDGSYAPMISSDGSRLVFLSLADDLVANAKDLNQGQDVFSHETAGGATSVVSSHAPEIPSLSPAPESGSPSMSADGRFIAFHSEAAHLVAGQSDSNHRTDVFLYDRSTRTTVLVSRANGSATRTPNGASLQPVISANGQYIAFISDAPDLAPGADDPDEHFELFLFDRISGTTTLVGSLGTRALAFSSSVSQTLSTDGRWVAFASLAPNLVSGPSEPTTGFILHLYLWDRLTRSTVLVSHTNAGPAVTATADSYTPLVSADGRFVLFSSEASNLVPGQIDSSFRDLDLFLFDRTTGATTLVSHAEGSSVTATTISGSYSFTPDARFIAFASRQGAQPGELTRVYLYDRVQGTIQLISRSGGTPSISADGRYIAFRSDQEILPGSAVSPYTRPYLYDRVSRSLTLITGTSTTGESIQSLVMSPNGRYVAFRSNATDLVPGQVSAPGRIERDLFLFDRTAGRLTLASRPAASPLTATGRASDPLLTDGGQVAFVSPMGLAPEDFNDQADVYLFSLAPTPPVGPTPLPACKLLDTRRRADRPVLTSNVQRAVAVRGACGVPASAKKVVVKVTVFNPSGKGNLRFYPGTVTATPAGILRFERSATRTETFTLPLSSNGTLTILPFVAGKGTVHAAVEVNGYFQ